MRCDICDHSLSEPRWNADHEKYEPCDECLTVIYDTIGAYRDKPSADEDDFLSEPILEGLFPPSENPFETSELHDFT